MIKYYRVLKDTFMWNKDSIIQDNGNGEYRSIEDFMDRVDLQTEYISARIIEDKGNAEFFERVYRRGCAEQFLFETAETMKELVNKGFKKK